MKAKTVPDLIDAFGGPTEFAVAVKIKRTTASEMSRTASIAPRHWVRVVKAARNRRIPLTYKSLAVMHAE